MACACTDAKHWQTYKCMQSKYEKKDELYYRSMTKPQVDRCFLKPW